ncbi:helix-turn-helix domain-containing protein [Streptomyces sp. NPDC015184]|uniref:helix-turn-helix domain-containing protein n=1 Tax=Streptomyces sp. NPDC015184 TaxID=3364946 RepID=UPI0036F8B1F1
MSRPLTETGRRAVRRHHAAGMSRNDIARKIGRSPSTVSKLAAGVGPGFDRAAEVPTATAVRKAGPDARHTEVAHRLHDVAEREIGHMTHPRLCFEWGGPMHT